MAIPAPATSRPVPARGSTAGWRWMLLVRWRRHWRTPWRWWWGPWGQWLSVGDNGKSHDCKRRQDSSSMYAHGILSSPPPLLPCGLLIAVGVVFLEESEQAPGGRGVRLPRGQRRNCCGRFSWSVTETAPTSTAVTTKSRLCAHAGAVIASKITAIHRRSSPGEGIVGAHGAGRAEAWKNPGFLGLSDHASDR
jgi:hypothetical protein